MIIDEVDLKIIEILYHLPLKEVISLPYGLVKKIYPSLNDYERKKRYTNIKRKLDKLSSYGVIKLIKDMDSIKNYQLQSDKVDFKRMKFKDGIKNVVCIKVTDEGWSAFEFTS